MNEYLKQIHEDTAKLNIKVFFVVMGTAPIKAFQSVGINDFLISAYAMENQISSPKKALLYLKQSNLLLDSGMISAWRRKDMSWLNSQPRIIELANEIQPTFVSHLDLPVEKHLLALNRFNRKEAINITIRNAIEFMDAKISKSRKIFALQGWTIDDYSYCFQEFVDNGIIDYCHAKGHAIGVGSMCLRKPTEGLFQICEQIREWTDGLWLHIFGVGQLEFQKRFAQMHIDSTDSGSALINWAFRYRNCDPK